MVDWTAAYALTKTSALGPCLGLSSLDSLYPHQHNKKVMDFFCLCTHHLSYTGHVTKDGTHRTPTIELTISHEEDIVYDIQLAHALYALPEIRYLEPHRLVIIYQSPLPRVEDPTLFDLDMLLEETKPLDEIPVEPKDPTASGVFMRPLNEEAFAKHVKGLEWH